MIKSLISVVICTQNRSDLLKITLDSVINQSLKRSRFEIIVVDNSTDKKTSLLIKSFHSHFLKPEIIYYHEPHCGLSRARNIGYKQSRGKYVSFLDDDAKVDHDFLEKIEDSFQKLDRDTIAIGGPIIPYYTSSKPAWFKDEYEMDYKGDLPRFLKRNESFSGSDMIWRREYLKEYGGFAENLGMHGEVMAVGEETELFERIWKRSKNERIFYYIPDLKVYHLVPAWKIKIKYRLIRWFIYGQFFFTKSPKKIIYKKGWDFIRIAGYFVVSLILAIFMYFKYSYYQNWLVERVGPLMFCLGYLTSCFGINIRPKVHLSIS